jgi:Protein of unknown function (DUF1203)
MTSDAKVIWLSMNESYPFRISGIPANVIEQFRQLPDEELKKRGVVRYIADTKPGFPCRVTLQDAEVGEPVLLLNFEHLPGLTPYRSIGPIFVRESVTETYSVENELPEVVRERLLAVRAYDRSDMMIEAEITEGAELKSLIQRMFTNSQIAHLHIHNADRGCYSCRVDRIT